LKCKPTIGVNVGAIPLPIISRLKEEFSFIQGNYAILVLSWIIMDFAMELPGTYYSLYVVDPALGGTETILGIIGFASFLALALVQFPGGYLADRHGRRWLISTMTFGVALSYIFYALAPSWHFILVGAMVGSLCLIYQPALLAMTADSLPSKKRGMGFSIITLITRVATTPAPAVAAFMVTVYEFVPGMRICYFIVVALFLTAATLRSRLRETVGEGGSIDRREFVSSYPRAIREGVAVWKKVPRSMYYLFLSNIVGTFGFALCQLLFNVYAVDTFDEFGNIVHESVLHISTVDWAILGMFLFVTMIVFAIPVGKLVDKVGRKIPILLGLGLIIPSMVLFVQGDLLKLYIAMPLVGVAQILMMAGFSALQADLVPRGQRGKIIGSSNFVNYLIMALGMLAGGFIYEHVSPQLPFLIPIVFTIPEILIILFLVHEPEKREE